MPATVAHRPHRCPEARTERQFALTYRPMPATPRRACTWYIRHVDLFRHLSQREADDMARAMTRKRFAAGQLIVSPETQPEVVFLTRTGTVRLFHRTDQGRDSTV